MDIIVLPAFQSFCSTFLECQPLLDRVRDTRIVIGQEAIQSHLTAQMKDNMKSSRANMIATLNNHPRPSIQSSSMSAASSRGPISPPQSTGPSASDLGSMMSRGQSHPKTRRTLSNTGLSPNSSSNFAHHKPNFSKTTSIPGVARSAGSASAAGRPGSSPITQVKSSPHIDLGKQGTSNASGSSMSKSASLPVEMEGEAEAAMAAAAAATVSPSAASNSAKAEEAVKNNGKAPVASAVPGPVRQVSMAASGSSGSQASDLGSVRLFNSTGGQPKSDLTGLGITNEEDMEGTEGFEVSLTGNFSMFTDVLQQLPKLEPPSEEFENSI